MNINYKTHSILEPLNRLKNKKKTAIAGVTQITQNSARQEVYINLEEFIELLNFNNINVYRKNLFEKVIGQKFDFFKYFDTFFKNDDLSDEGIILRDKSSYVYSVKKSKNKYFFSFYEIVGKKDWIHILAYSWGNVKIENNKYQGFLTQSRNLAELTDPNFDWDSNFDKAFHAIMAIIFNHIIFKKFAPIETKKIITSDKTRYRTYRPNKNQLGLKINYITSQWFTNLERSGAFGVKGHWRLQACGEGMKDRKLIWIKDFIKEGYTKRAQRLIEEEKLNS
jgi:hypothetical protein